jgi:hypothetical protein
MIGDSAATAERRENATSTTPTSARSRPRQRERGGIGHPIHPRARGAARFDSLRSLNDRGQHHRHSTTGASTTAAQ